VATDSGLETLLKKALAGLRHCCTQLSTERNIRMIVRTPEDEYWALRANPQVAENIYQPAERMLRPYKRACTVITL
jgi:hypothetical protein